MNKLMHISALDNLAAFFFDPDYVEIETKKDYRCHECKQWFEETVSFFDEETNKEVELCDECTEIYKQ